MKSSSKNRIKNKNATATNSSSKTGLKVMKQFKRSKSKSKQKKKPWSVNVNIESICYTFICFIFFCSMYSMHVMHQYENLIVDAFHNANGNTNGHGKKHGTKHGKINRKKDAKITATTTTPPPPTSTIKAKKTNNLRNPLEERERKAAAKAKSKTKVQAQQDPKKILHNDILQTIADKKLRPYGAEAVWEDIIQKGHDIMKDQNYKTHLTVVEVGAQNEKQSLLAAKAQFHIHCVEPSPKSFENIYRTMMKEVKKEEKNNKDDNNNNNMKQYIHLYNAAAGAESGGMLDFYTTGGTGDHVGEFDMWNMKPGKMPDDWPEEKRGKMVKVPSIQLDDIIYENKVKPSVLEGLEDDGSNNNNDVDISSHIDTVYALKVDTQGFEPSVFAGLKKSIQAHKIQYIMTEYWPKGIGLIADRLDDPCDVAVQMLDILTDAGYKLYALPTQGHPSAWSFSPTIFHHVANWRSRPLHDYRADCQHFLDFEKEFPNPEYHMGYWSDILAIAPGSEPFVPKKKPKKVNLRN